MTAYGRAEYTLGDTLFISEIKTVNNRYRDIILRIPKNFQVLDKELRSIISAKIKRGRIEASIQMEENGEENPYTLELNKPLVNSYFKIFNQLAEQFWIDHKIQPLTKKTGCSTHLYQSDCEQISLLPSHERPASKPMLADEAAPPA